MPLTKRQRKTKAARRRAQAEARNRQVREDNVEAAEIAELVKRGPRTKPALEVYLNRGQISEEQYKSGMSLRADWIGMGKSLSPGRVKAQSLELLDSGGYSDITPYQMDCKDRFTAALRSVGKILASCMINVCLHDMPASIWAVSYGGRRQASDGIACLRAGLDGLRLHYDRGTDAAWREWLDQALHGEWQIKPYDEGENFPLAKTAPVDLGFNVSGAELSLVAD
jgi:hypothetical protein